MAENEVKEIQNAGEQAVPNKAVPQKTVKDKEPISAENAAKQAALKAALAQIEKQFGKGAVMKLGETTALNVESISTGSIGLDIALGVGGVPRGRIVEIFGPESSGKTTVALQIVAQAQKNGGEAAFIDVEHAIDPTYAKALGVDIDRLLISQPDSGEQALEIIEQLVRSGAIDVVVLDSVAAMVTKAEIEGEMGDSHVGLQARLMSQAMRKLTSVVAKNNCVAIFINQIREKIGVTFGNPETTPGGRALKFYASVRIDVRKGESIKVNGESVGSRTKCKVVKNKVAPPFKETEYDIIFGEGISVEGEIIDLASSLDIINKSGAWFSYGEERLGQGRDNAKEYLKQHPEIAEEIRQKILENQDQLQLISKKAKKGLLAAKTVSKANAKAVNLDAEPDPDDFGQPQ
ncbi:MAG TPA: recombinase RecA [Firmicutes bacterium]|nr:recombinase RecA [Bacillota bacterium]